MQFKVLKDVCLFSGGRREISFRFSWAKTQNQSLTIHIRQRQLRDRNLQRILEIHFALSKDFSSIRFLALAFVSFIAYENNLFAVENFSLTHLNTIKS